MTLYQCVVLFVCLAASLFSLLVSPVDGDTVSFHTTFEKKNFKCVDERNLGLRLLVALNETENTD